MNSLSGPELIPVLRLSRWNPVFVDRYINLSLPHGLKYRVLTAFPNPFTTPAIEVVPLLVRPGLVDLQLSR